MSRLLNSYNESVTLSKIEAIEIEAALKRYDVLLRTLFNAGDVFKLGDEYLMDVQLEGEKRQSEAKRTRY